MPAATPTCPFCGGGDFDPPQRPHRAACPTAPTVETVRRVTYARHSRIGRPDVLRLTYALGGAFGDPEAFEDWHLDAPPSPARHRAADEWNRRSRALRTPASVTDALAWAGDLEVPATVLLEISAGCIRVTDPRFHSERLAA